MKSKITTLEELEKEQKKLEMMMEVTKQEFARNLGTNRKQLQNYLLTRVALPVGAIGVGTVAAKKIMSEDDPTTESAKSSSMGLLKKLIPLGINLFQAYLAKRQKEKLEAIPNRSIAPNSKKARNVA
ncbi:MAG: hypothetical protein AAF573_20535 [Bacteroidota bacterium]